MIHNTIIEKIQLTTNIIIKETIEGRRNIKKMNNGLHTLPTNTE